MTTHRDTPVVPAASGVVDEWSEQGGRRDRCRRWCGRRHCRSAARDRGRCRPLDTDADELERVVGSLDPFGERLSFFAADIRDESQVNALAEHALKRSGRLHGWVNNAGTIELGPALETSRAAVVRQLDTNVVALLQCCQAAARAIGETGGAIVNVASNAGEVGFPDMVGYNASKAAVINLTRSLAEEWAGRGVNVNAVFPGSVRTAMLRRVAQYHAGKNHLETDEVLESFVPHQLGEPSSLSRWVVWSCFFCQTLRR